MKSHKIVATAATLTAAVPFTDHPQSYDQHAPAMQSIQNGCLGRFVQALVCHSSDEAGDLGQCLFYVFERDGVRYFRQMSAAPQDSLETARNIRLCVQEGDTIRETTLVRPNTPGRRELCAVDCKALGNIFFTF